MILCFLALRNIYISLGFFLLFNNIPGVNVISVMLLLQLLYSARISVRSIGLPKT